MEEKMIEPGYTFNNYTVIEKAERNRWGQRQWVCQCVCGNKTVVVHEVVKKGELNKCKECHIKEVGHGNLIDLTGQNFGEWTVIRREGTYKNGHPKWRCQCSCGKIGHPDRANLINGWSKSCGKCNCYEEINGWFWSVLVNHAAKRNIKFEISIEDVWDLYIRQNKKCALTGLDIKFGNHGKKNNTASIDRIDSLKAYTINNIQIVHKAINIMKNSFSNEVFFTLCNLVCETMSENTNKIENILPLIDKLKIGANSRNVE